MNAFQYSKTRRKSETQTLVLIRPRREKDSGFIIVKVRIRAFTLDEYNKLDD
jgi:hypothetical protein